MAPMGWKRQWGQPLGAFIPLSKPALTSAHSLSLSQQRHSRKQAGHGAGQARVPQKKPHPPVRCLEQGKGGQNGGG